jgi:hypothetical protein
MALLEPLFDAALEDALDGALRDAAPSGAVAIAGVLERRGTRRSAGALGALILDASDEADGGLPEALGGAIAAIASRDGAPDAVVAAAVPDAPADRLPPGARLRGLLRALSAAPASAPPRLRELAERVARERGSDDERVAALAPTRLAWIYEALAATGDRDGIASVTGAIDLEPAPATRLLWIRALAGATAAGRDAALVGWLVERAAAGGDEGATACIVLGAVSGKPFGRRVDLWRGYLATCEATDAPAEVGK